MLVYLETGMGACIRKGRSVAAVERATLKEVGTANGVSLARKATPRDIDNVRAMGGRVPER